MSEPEHQLKRTLSLPMLTFYGVGMILGAGIYSIIGKAAGIADQSLWLSFLLASFTAGLTALSYAELSSMIPKAGAEYNFLSHAFPKQRWLATAAGLMMTFSLSATAAAVAIAFSGYLSHFLSIPQVAIAAVLIISFSVLSIYGVSESSRVNAVLTCIEATGLILVIGLGIYSPSFGEPLSIPLSSGTLPAASLLFFAYLGFENLVNFTEETKNPQRDMPRAIFLSLAISTVLYFLVGLSVLAILPPSELALSNAPLMDVAMKKSVFFGEAIGLIALVSTANTVLIGLMTGSRVLYGISKGGDLPGSLSLVHSKRKTPWASSLLIMVTALLLLPFGSVETVASLSAFSTMLCFLLVNLALITLRFKKPQMHRPFRVPFNAGPVPILSVAAVLATLVLISEFELKVYFVTGTLFLTIYLLKLFKKGLA